MSDHSLSSSRRLNNLAAACLSISLATGTVYATSTSAPVAFAQDAETGNNDSDNGGNGGTGNDNGNGDEDSDVQPEESSLSNSSVASDEESALAKVINSLSLILAVGGIAGAMVSLIAHFAAMALPSVPWQN